MIKQYQSVAWANKEIIKLNQKIRAIYRISDIAEYEEMINDAKRNVELLSALVDHLDVLFETSNFDIWEFMSGSKKARKSDSVKYTTVKQNEGKAN